MNIYGIIILSALLLKFLLDALADWLNLRSLDPKLPEEFADLYDSEKYARSQEYTRVRTKFGLIESTAGLAALLLFWFLGGFEILDEWIRSRGWSQIPTGIAYIAALGFASSILSLPFDVYSTFVIEERFGFNKTTVATFIKDRIKGLLLGAVLGIPLLAVILWFFAATGPAAWIYCWVVSIAFTLLVQFIAPVWIFPLFNKFTPLPDGELKTAIADYARSVRFSFKDIFVIDGSRRSKKANAFFTGFGKNKRIALFDTLVAQQTVPEIVAVLAHEIGHYKKKHVLKMMVISFLHMGILFFLLSLFLNSRGLFEAFYIQKPSIYTGLVFFGLLYEPVSFLLSMLLNALSRKHELQADRYAVETISTSDWLVSALKKLHVENLSNLTPHAVYVFLHYSHPPLVERIRGIRSARAV